MLQIAALVLAQGGSNTAEAPDGGVGAVLIIVVLIAIAVVFAGLFLFISKRTSASRGGVEPVPGSREPGPPPFESIEREKE